MTTISATPRADERISVKSVPFFLMHLVVLGAFFTGARPIDWAVCLGLYYLRMFGITAGYHRYFSHRTFRAGRVVQMFFALLGLASTQKGPLWWAAHHRHHHRFSDQPEDVHSPRQRGFWWSHMFWILVERHNRADLTQVKDLTRYPELRFVDRHAVWFTVLFAVALYLIGGSHALVWGYFVSTVLLWHGTFTINSLTHVWGKRRYATTDDSRNNFWLAILTLGEGWHNNHHYYQRSTRQGFYWWEIDLSFYVLKVMEVLHLVSDVQGVPRHVRDQIAAPGRERLDAAPSAPAA